MQCPSCKAVFLAAKRANPEPPPSLIAPFQPTAIREKSQDGPPLSCHSLQAVNRFSTSELGDVGLPINREGNQPSPLPFPLHCNFEPLLAAPPSTSERAIHTTTTAEVVPLQQPLPRKNRRIWAWLLLGELLVGRAFFLWRKEKADFHDAKDRTTRGLIVAILVSLLIVGGGFAILVLLTK